MKLLPLFALCLFYLHLVPCLFCLLFCLFCRLIPCLFCLSCGRASGLAQLVVRCSCSACVYVSLSQEVEDFLEAQLGTD